MASKKVPENCENYKCLICDYVTSRKSQYQRHILTIKHQKTVNASNLVPKGSTYNCSCGKIYKHESSYYKHKKTCKYLITDQRMNNKELVILLMKENHELKQMMTETQTQVMELLKNGTHNTTNSHNKTFNLNFFLNETCKNAMNIMDFVNNIQLQLSDLENMGDVGYVNGMSNIIVKSLKDMAVTERPVHCTDKKRDILYVKDNDKWDKETEEKPKIRKAIKHAAHKNAKLLLEFKEKHPDCIKSTSKHSDMYNKLMIEAMGGNGDNCLEKENKIIRNLIQEVILEKEKGILS